ncbi:hypothetical protein [Micromonospora sp. KC723]|uniref:hypothetical protein n=1 Tax=Micromonospora sp. KC723 TaxID=2530381 RepID=UPI001FB629DB|nr:hypothetical protein [Micromonospora sp. KC723]
MSGTTISVGPVLFVSLAALTLLAAAVFRLAGLGSGKAVLRAAARAVLQLGAVSAATQLLILVALLAVEAVAIGTTVARGMLRR